MTIRYGDRITDDNHNPLQQAPEFGELAVDTCASDQVIYGTGAFGVPGISGPAVFAATLALAASALWILARRRHRPDPT